MLTIKTIGSQSRIIPYTPPISDCIECDDIVYKVVRVLRVGNEDIRVSAICDNNYQIIYPTNGSIVKSELGYIFCFEYMSDACSFAEVGGYNSTFEVWECLASNPFLFNIGVDTRIIRSNNSQHKALMNKFWDGELISNDSIIYTSSNTIICESLIMIQGLHRYYH